MYERTYNGGDTLVILPCSDRRGSSGDMAVEAYWTRVVNHFRRVLDSGVYDDNVDCYFLSGKYGIIPPDFEVGDYDYEVTEEDIPDLMDEIGQFLTENDYEMIYSFVDGIYKQAMREVGYRRNSWYDIDATFVMPCCRSASMDGAPMLGRIIGKQVETNSAGETEW